MDDFTLEKLYRNLAENPRGIGIKVEELNGLFKTIGRYTKGSGPDVEFYNSFWSGEPKNVDRASGEPLYIPSAAITIFGTMQPGVISTMFGGGNDENGLTSRFLYTCLLNAQIPRQERKEFDASLLEYYNAIIGKLLDLEMLIDLDDREIPRELRLTEEAMNLYLNWHNEVFLPSANDESRQEPRRA